MNYDAVLIAGPTASGKSKVALGLAELLGAAIVNADSMQVYRELRVLTARPSDDDMARIPHHLYGHVSVHEAYSVGRYASDALCVREERSNIAGPMLFVGGTGLYFEALTQGLADIPAITETSRKTIRARYAKLEAPAIHAVLARCDPETARSLRPSDTQRILRALEVYEATGAPLAYWQKRKGRPVLQGMSVAKFFLDVPRELLRERIAARLQVMIAEGALEEVASIQGLDPALPAAKILGLRELSSLREGTVSVDAAIARIAILTGQYAKRQATWARQHMRDWASVRAIEPHTIIAEILTQIA
jgi:tRNA dimethylallyltransferase